VWYRKAADQGDSNAQYNLATLYLKGKGVAKDVDEAVRWCKKSAEQNDADALFLLAQLYESGIGVQQDLREAISLYTKLQGDDVAGLTYGMSQDAEGALERLRDMVENGD